MKRDIRLAVLLLSVVCLSLSLATAWQVWSARERTLAEIDTNNLNLAQTLDTYADGIITQSAMLLLGVIERLEAEGSGPAHLQRLQHLTERQESWLDQLNGLVIYDAHGNWLMSSSGHIPEGANSADRAFFIHHRDDPSPDIFIGPPIKSRSTGDWVLTVSRRFDDHEGRFAGVVAVALGIESFLRLFGKIDVGEQGTISLSTTGGQLLVRYPYREEDVGHDFSRSPNFRRYFSGVASGTASFRSGLDGTERIYAFRKSDRYPLVTTVALGKDEALRTWKNQAWLTIGVVLALLAIIVTIGRLLILDIKRRIDAEASLVSTREDLLVANHQLEILAAQDQLTGLANRRCFDERLAAESRRAGRDGMPLSLLLIDIDHFKGYNDTYGHIAGDECLRAFGEQLQQCVKRSGNLVARYGGEELAVILPNTDASGALSVAEHMLERINALGIGHSTSPFGRVTASIGTATVHGAQAAGRELELIESADRALYRAKAAGRNRVET
ncbi:GGDEF domain-containing protein [Metapseudomonas lalkuanensis]|uniref:diguanylate cyclase n=1 Tax=Metapseudomonas lalkuanensis TaxID=2604832 RepID=A0A5J6QK82_9GAMM|nr:sensor domain-containing diguanylate cyclase [Pseudomonas lalkuanensis]QEY63168.1 GGDEF domain-containing protein [Pseudomonas lalkuanensis]